MAGQTGRRSGDVTTPDPAVLLPGATLGILGGGQLGAMFAAAARRMGYRVEAVSDVADCPAARFCDRVHVGDYADTGFLGRVAAGLDVVTFEFENVPAAAGRLLADRLPVRPHPDVLFTTQDRAREKAFLVRHGFACAPHRVVRSRGELDAALRDIGLPAVLKTVAFGYDGKGQAKASTAPSPRSPRRATPMPITSSTSRPRRRACRTGCRRRRPTRPAGSSRPWASWAWPASSFS